MEAGCSEINHYIVTYHITIGVWAGGLQPPWVGQNNIFFGQSSNFSGSGQKMKNNILNIINEKYEKYSIGYSKIKCPKFEHFGVRHSFFGRCPIFFGQNRSSPPPKKWPVRLCILLFTRCGGVLKQKFVLICNRVCQQNNFENRLIFSEVMGKSLLSCFLTHDAVILLII